MGRLEEYYASMSSASDSKVGLAGGSTEGRQMGPMGRGRGGAFHAEMA